MRFRYSLRKMAEVFANSEDPDRRHRILHCLPNNLLGVSWLQRVKIEKVHFTTS